MPHYVLGWLLFVLEVVLGVAEDIVKKGKRRKIFY